MEKIKILTMECPRYSVTLSEMYRSLPSLVVIRRKPVIAWKQKINKQ